MKNDIYICMQNSICEGSDFQREYLQRSL